LLLFIVVATTILLLLVFWYFVRRDLELGTVSEMFEMSVGRILEVTHQGAEPEINCDFCDCLLIVVVIIVNSIITIIVGVVVAAVITVALCNRSDHYILLCDFYLSIFLFFPRLISAVGD